MRVYLTIVLGWMISQGVTAQSTERERSGFAYLYENSADIDSGGKVALEEVQLRLGYPVFRQDAFSTIAGFDWSRYEFDFSRGALRSDFTAHSLRFPLRAMWRNRERWSWMVMAAPSIRSDMEHVDWDDAGLSALALATYPWRTNARLSAGAVYSQDFGRSRVYPALGLRWTPSESWLVDIQFPRPRAVYRINRAWSVSSGLEPGGDQWNVHLDGRERDVSLKEFRTGVGVEWSPIPNFAVHVQGGYVFNRELEARGGGLPRDTVDLDDSYFARLQLIFR